VERTAVVHQTRHATRKRKSKSGSVWEGSLALGLEFAVGADILRTAVAPNAAIAVLRTGLNYGLEREIVREERRALTCAARASSD
jgi:uncharacterized membrane protein